MVAWIAVKRETNFRYFRKGDVYFPHQQAVAENAPVLRNPVSASMRKLAARPLRLGIVMPICEAARNTTGPQDAENIPSSPTYAIARSSSQACWRSGGSPF